MLWSAFGTLIAFGQLPTLSPFHLADRQGALRLFQNLLPLLYAAHDLYSNGVTQPELYLFLYSFARLASGGFHIGHTVAQDRKSTRLNSSHVATSYAVFCLKKK